MGKCEQCIIKQFNVLKSLSKEELIRISSCKTSMVVKKGMIIFDEGDTLKGVYCVKDGISQLPKLSSKGKDQSVKLGVKGYLLGQRSLVTDAPANLQATVLTDMERCFIPTSEIVHDLLHNTKFSCDV